MTDCLPTDILYPDHLAGCQKLKTLEFQGNMMVGFPTWKFSRMIILRLENNRINTNIPDYFSSVVPESKPVVIMPQKEGYRVCGELPSGPKWAEVSSTGALVALSSLPNCNSVSPATIPPPSPTTPASPPPAPPSNGSGLSTGAIIGIAVGGAVALILLAIMAIMFCRPKKKTMDGSYEDYGMKDEELAYGTMDRGSGGATPLDPYLNGAILGAPLVKQASGISQSSALRSDIESSGNMSIASHTRVPSSQALPIDVKFWTVSFNDLQLEKQIGEGSFGRVYMAKWNETLVAVKMLSSVGNSTDEDASLTLSNPVFSNLAKESNMMAALRHPNVVAFLGVCLEPPCIITEYCARGSLTDVLRGAKASPAKASLLDWPRRLNMALDAAKGMLYLHNHAPPIIHRDLKSPNLLVDKHWRLKVSDFNLSKLLEEGAVMSSMAATNPRWLAPEILGGNNATFASDVYSYGVVMWELMTWDLPWGVTNPWQVVTVVMEGGRLSVPSRADLPGPDNFSFGGLEDYISLMQRCWSQIQEDRPTFQEIISELRDILAQALAKAGKVVTPTRSGSEDSQMFGKGNTDGDSTATSHEVSRNHLAASERSMAAQEDLYYASTGAQTGSMIDVRSLNASWSTKLKSHLTDFKE